MSELSLEKKRELARRLLKEKRAANSDPDSTQPDYEQFLLGTDPSLSEVRAFSNWLDQSGFHETSSFARARVGAAGSRTSCQSKSSVLNFATYNYLGLSAHPAVVNEAKQAIELYGIGSGASPAAGGQLRIHQELKQDLVEFFELPNSEVALFSAGYNVNTGTISALMKPGTHVVLDSLVHMSLLEGARLSGASIHTFQHNDVGDLKRVLESLLDQRARILVCAEGVYSADGDFGCLADIADTAKRYGALFLVDEAHSALLCGARGRGAAACQAALDKVDLLVLTFSKAFGGVGGALVADRSIIRYVSWYARSHLFSCAMSPGVTAGVRQALQLAKGEEGERRRARLRANAEFLRAALAGRVSLCGSGSWIVPF